jgi:hypothetical protein
MTVCILGNSLTGLTLAKALAKINADRLLPIIQTDIIFLILTIKIR